MLDSQHATQAARRFSRCQVAQIQLSPEHAQMQVPLGAGSLSMTTHAFQLGDFYTLRGVYIKSAKIEIANLFLFPTPHYRLPLHVLEVVLLSGKPIAVILDQVDLSSQGAVGTAQLVQLRQQHDQMINSADIPAWFAECRSGSEFFLRPDTTDEVTDLLRVHDQMLSALAAICDQPPRLSTHESAQHALRINHYKQHHAQNAPGRPLLCSAFDAEWADRYFTTCLFA